jgi:hypothetical protein
MRDHPERAAARLALRISEVVLELLDTLEREEPDIDPYLASTQRTVEMFLASLPSRLSEPWTVDAMAAECGLGRNGSSTTAAKRERHSGGLPQRTAHRARSGPADNHRHDGDRHRL